MTKLKTPRRKPAVITAQSDIGPDEIRNRIVGSLEDDKGEEIVVIPLIGRSALADYMVIVSGRSTRQVSAMADHLRESLGKMGIKVRLEGMAEANWVIVDAGDVIVHLFRPEVRGFYNLEKMWLADLDEPRIPPDPELPSITH